MRKILFKNITALDSMKKDLSVCEILDKNGVITRTERRCVYFVRKKIHMDDPSDLSGLSEMKEDEGSWKKKHFHILREHDSDSGEDKLFCKVAGNLYAIVGQDVYCVAFVHSFKIGLVTAPSPD